MVWALVAMLSAAASLMLYALSWLALEDSKANYQRTEQLLIEVREGLDLSERNRAEARRLLDEAQGR